MVKTDFIYRGICGALGFAVAKPLIIKDTNYNVEDHNFTDFVSEKQKLEDAIKTVHDRLEKQVEQTKKQQNEANANVVEAHIQLLSDPTVKEQIINEIEKNEVPAVKAIHTIMKQWEETFRNSDSDYFRQRANDVVDVYTQVIKTVLNIEIIDLSTIKEEVILIAHDLLPSQTSQLNPVFIKGIVTEIGGATSHTALMAESMKIPAILGVNNITEKIGIENGRKIILHSTANDAYVNIKPTHQDILKIEKEIKDRNDLEEEIKQFIGKKTETSDHKIITLEANIGGIKDAKKAFQLHAEGIGLMRTEFLYMENKNELPTEETQYKAYKQVLKEAKGLPVTIRTIDIGGDKKLPSLPLEEELNPFLGYRAIRISLTNKSLFRTQLRALFRASKYGNLRIMFPFISNVGELKDAKEFALSVKKELSTYDKIEDINDNVKIGMMIEIPSTIWMASTYAEYVDFFSVGTNDLVQYMYAVDRMNPKVGSLGSYFDPALIKALNELIKRAKNTSVAMCGQMAGDPLALPILVGLGFEILSMSAVKILKTRRHISYINKGQAKKLVKKIIKEAETAADVIEMIKERYGDLK